MLGVDSFPNCEFIVKFVDFLLKFNASLFRPLCLYDYVIGKSTLDITWNRRVAISQFSNSSNEEGGGADLESRSSIRKFRVIVEGSHSSLHTGQGRSLNINIILKQSVRNYSIGVVVRTNNTVRHLSNTWATKGVATTKNDGNLIIIIYGRTLH